MSLRVLLISHTCQSPAEGQRKVVELAGRDGIELKVVIPDRWKHYGAWRALAIDDDARPYLDVHRVRLPWAGPAQFYLHHYPSLGRTIRAFRPDVIDAWEEPWSLVAWQACRLRDRWAPGAKVLVETEQNLDRTLPPPFEWIRGSVLRRADGLVGRSMEAVEVARRRGYDGPADVLPNAVDDALFRPMDRAACRRELGLSGFTIGYVGRMIRAKGLFDLLDAVAASPCGVEAMFVGDGADLDALQRHAAELGVADRVRFEPGRPLDELPSVMNGIDALALPSRTTGSWKEQFGRVLIEAMSCGTAVIGSSSGAIPEVIDDATMIFPEGDAGALAKLLTRLSQTPGLNDAERCRARRDRVLAEFTWARVAERYHAVFDRLVGGTGAGPGATGVRERMEAAVPG